MDGGGGGGMSGDFVGGERIYMCGMSADVSDVTAKINQNPWYLDYKRMSADTLRIISLFIIVDLPLNLPM